MTTEEIQELTRINAVEIQNLKADIYQLNRELERLQRQLEKLNISIDDIENECISKEFDLQKTLNKSLGEIKEMYIKGRISGFKERAKWYAKKLGNSL